MKDAINMTIQDAIQEIDGLVHSAMVEYNTKDEEDAHDEEVLGVAVWAMKKQIPMKPERIMITMFIRGPEYTCGCGAYVGYLHEYRYNCGQKLDWED